MSQDTNADLFIASVLPWFHTEHQRIIEHLDRALDGPDRRRVIEWRADVVTDYRGFSVRASAERLIRWDSRPPSEIFRDGFRPHYRPDTGDNLDLQRMDLHSYVYTNANSIFVGTARYYRQNNRDTRWVPRTIRNRFEYEVFAFGGIDVNLSLGSQHPYHYQREVAFPGGIRPEFIRTAREYNNEGHVVQVWANAGFDISASGAHHASHLQELPDTVCGPRLSLRFWPSDEDDSDDRSHRAPRSASDDLQLDVMREDGAPEEDDLVGNIAIQRASFTLPGTTYTYFFAGTQYAQIDVQEDTVTNGPKFNLKEWPSLKLARFPTVDAVLPVPSHSGEAYFFSGTQYARIKVNPNTTDDEIVNGPKPISTEWPPLEEARFRTVDAVLPVPFHEEEAYFFSGTQYARIGVKPGTTDDTLLSGPESIVDGWPSLKRAGFSTIDSALPVPGVDGEAYFFSGIWYTRVKIMPGTRDDYIIGCGVWNTAAAWKSLQRTGFY